MSWRERISNQVDPLDDEYGTGKGHCLRCGAEWNGHLVCHCSLCHLTFTAVGGFDVHRTGRDDARRCLTPDEMTGKGYEPNEDNQWRKPAPEGAFTNRRTARS